MNGLELVISVGTLFAALIALIPTCLALLKNEWRDERTDLRDENRELKAESKQLRDRNAELEEENLRLMRKLFHQKN